MVFNSMFFSMNKKEDDVSPGLDAPVYLTGDYTKDIATHGFSILKGASGTTDTGTSEYTTSDVQYISNNKSINLSAGGDWVKIVDGNNQFDITKFSISFWAFPTGDTGPASPYPAYRPIFTDTLDHIKFFLMSDGSFFGTHQYTSTNGTRTQANLFENGTWSHFCITVEEVSDKSYYKFYVNGSLVATIQHTKHTQSTKPHTFSLGKRHFSSYETYDFDSYVDNFRFYPKSVLTAQEVLDIYNSEKPS